MKIIYRNQLGSGDGYEVRSAGWKAWLFGILAVLVVIAVAAVLIPFLIVGILGFIALLFFAMLFGWIFLGFRVGWRDWWEFTKLMCGITFGTSRGGSRRERIKRAWEEKVKGKSGEWVK